MSKENFSQMSEEVVSNKDVQARKEQENSTDEKWQTELKTALENYDFQLVDLLMGMKPELEVDKNLILSVTEKILLEKPEVSPANEKRREQDLFWLEALRKMLENFPNSGVEELCEEELKKLIDICMNDVHVNVVREDQIRAMLQMGIKIDADWMQEQYYKMRLKNSAFPRRAKTAEIRDLVGVREDEEKILSLLIKSNWREAQLYEVAKLSDKKEAGEKVDVIVEEGQWQAVYEDCYHRGGENVFFNLIKDRMKYRGESALPEKKLMNRIYKDLLQWEKIDECVRWYEMTMIKSEIEEEEFFSLIKKMMHYHDVKTALVDLEKFCLIFDMEQIKELIVKEMFDYYAARKYFHSEKAVNETIREWRKFLRKENWMVPKEWSQNLIKRLLDNDNISQLYILVKGANLDISDWQEEIKNVIIKKISHYRLEDLQDYSDFFGIELLKTKQEQINYLQLLAEDFRFEELIKLQNHWGISLEPELINQVANQWWQVRIDKGITNDINEDRYLEQANQLLQLGVKYEEKQVSHWYQIVWGKANNKKRIFEFVREITQIDISPAGAQAIYTTLLKNFHERGSFSMYDFENLFELTKIKPNWSEQQKQEFYQQILKDNPRQLIEFKKIMGDDEIIIGASEKSEREGIKLEQEKIDKMITELIEGKQWEKLNDLYLALELEMSEKTKELIKEKTQEWLKNTGFNLVARRRAEDFQLADRKFVYDQNYFVREIKWVVEILGVKLDEEIVQEFYHNLVLSGLFDFKDIIMEVSEKTGVEPEFDVSGEEMQKELIEYVLCAFWECNKTLLLWKNILFVMQKAKQKLPDDFHLELYEKIAAGILSADEKTLLSVKREDLSQGLAWWVEKSGVQLNEKHLASLLILCINGESLSSPWLKKGEYIEGMRELLSSGFGVGLEQVNAELVADYLMERLEKNASVGIFEDFLKFWPEFGKAAAVKSQGTAINDALLKKDFPYVLDSLIQLTGEDKVKLSEEVVQNYYLKKIKDNFKNKSFNATEFWVRELELVRRISGIDIKMDGEIGEKIDLMYKVTKLAYWQNINDALGVSPSEEIVQEKYEIILLNGKKDGWQEILEITGAMPSEELVKKTLQSMIKAKELKKAKEILEWMNWELPEELMTLLLEDFLSSKFKNWREKKVDYELVKNFCGEKWEQVRQKLRNQEWREKINNFYQNILLSDDFSQKQSEELAQLMSEWQVNWQVDGEEMNILWTKCFKGSMEKNKDIIIARLEWVEENLAGEPSDMIVEKMLLRQAESSWANFLGTYSLLERKIIENVQLRGKLDLVLVEKGLSCQYFYELMEVLNFFDLNDVRDNYPLFFDKVLVEIMIRMKDEDERLWEYFLQNYNNIPDIPDKFLIFSSLLDGIANKVGNHWFNEIKYIKLINNNVDLSKPELQELLADKLLKSMGDSYFGNAIALVDLLQVVKMDFFHNADWLEQAKVSYKKGIIELANRQRKDNYQEIKKRLSLMIDERELVGELEELVLGAFESNIREYYQYLRESNFSNEVYIALLINLHDDTLFVERIFQANEDEQKREKIRKMIVERIVDSETDFQLLNEYFGYFNWDEYVAEKGEKPVVNMAEFERYCLFKKYDIKIPEGASEKYALVMTDLMRVKGIDIKFLKYMCEIYEKNPEAVIDDESDWQDDDFEGEFSSSDYDLKVFAERLINIIEGEENINEIQREFLTKEYGEKFLPILDLQMEKSIDPVNKSIFTAIGLRSLNLKTLDYWFLFEAGAGESKLREVKMKLLDLDKKQRFLIEAEKEEKIKKIEQDETRTEKEKRQQISQVKTNYEKKLRTLLFKYGDGESVIGVNVGQMSTLDMELESEKKAEIIEKLQEALKSDGLEKKHGKMSLAELVINTLEDFYLKKESVEMCLDLLKFGDLRGVAEKIFKKLEEESRQKMDEDLKKGEMSKTEKEYWQEAKKSIEVEELMTYFENKELSLLSLMFYLGYDNRKRQTTSLEVMKKVDKIVSGEKYKKQVTELQKRGLVAGKQDVVIAYCKGDLHLDEEDNGAMNQILLDYGYKNMGRKIKIELGPKDNHKLWTCGDKTDCCMSFTDYKNREYLLRPDMSYLGISLVNDEVEDLVAQSVVVYAKENDGTIVIALDNIEIANRAIKNRSQIAMAYQQFKEQLIKKLAGEKFKIVIGTSYNDDGGLVTGNCGMEQVLGQPLAGSMRYSDWQSHDANFVFYDSEKTKVDYLGLANYTVQENDEILKKLTDYNFGEVEQVKVLLDKIGVGEDDGDGGLLFPDNYSRIIGNIDDPKGLIVAAVYLEEGVQWDDEEDDEEDELSYLVIEKVGFQTKYSLEEKKQMIRDYLSNNQFEIGNKVAGIKLSAENMSDENLWVREVLEEYYQKELVGDTLDFMEEEQDNGDED